MSLLVIIPTRGRPTQAKELLSSFQETRTLMDSAIVFGIDDEDPTLAEYIDLGIPRYVGQRRGMVGTLNDIAARSWDAYDILAFLGDDHRFRTHAWDVRVSEELLTADFVYGNDLFQGEALPTAIFMRSSVAKALGYMALPSLRHLYVDNYWLVLGKQLDAIRYLPDVIVEHMHPAIGKAQWDPGYVRVNSTGMWEHDRVAYEAWLAGDGLCTEVRKIRAMTEART